MRQQRLGSIILNIKYSFLGERAITMGLGTDFVRLSTNKKNSAKPN
jgi:hypothetical protein